MDAIVRCSDIAEAMGITVRAVNMRATKEEWPANVMNKRGDRCFALHTLPADVRAVIVSKQSAPSLEVKPAVAPQLREWQLDKAKAWADLCALYLDHVRRKGRCRGQVLKVKRDFVMAYNAGAYPYIYGIIGETSFKTLERKVKKLKRADDPLVTLAPRHGSHNGQRSVGPEQAQVLLSIVRSPYQPKKVSEIIRIARAVMDQKGVEDSLSDATYRRWLDDWVSVHFDEWTFWREGEKGLHDKCLYWIERDYDRIEVGDILVADGHILNFETLNPWTGKPKRMTLILWYDMKSNFPAGWEIMPTENTQAIAAALRRAILMLGKFPKIAYLDNGRAFASRFFNGVNLEEAGFTGLFERLGIRPIYAWPYHAQSKTVERFFGSMAELERISPSYVGTSIAEKPPRLNRGERLHRQIHQKIVGDYVPTLEETHLAVASWFDEYVRRPQKSGHLQGIRPADVFLEGRGPGVDAAVLRELMMHMEIRTIRRRGIQLFGKDSWYYSPALYGRKHPVKIYYDLQDKTSIMVYDARNDQFLCEAGQTEKVHPAAQILGTPEDQALLEDQIALKKRLIKGTVRTAREFVETGVIPEVRRQVRDAGFALDEKAGIQKEAKQKKVVALPLTENQKDDIEKEFAAAEAAHRREQAGTWDDLQGLPDVDRYEKLVEAEARGTLIPKDWQAFMRYFEETEQYRKLEGYFDELRVKTALVYQTN